MFKKINWLKDALTRLHDPVEYDFGPYRKVLNDIDKMRLGRLSDGELKKIASGLRDNAQKGVSPDDLLAESFALVREASWRVLGMKPFNVQVMAAVALHRGRLVEMQTGEGKTLAAVMPVFLNALSGRGVHVLTFNDYLARRDSRWMVPVYEFLGLTAGHVVEGMTAAERQKAYLCDATYVTAREAGFDHLRDFMCTDKERLVHRPFNYAIVDEADSILIDEARVPLVIAGEASGDEESPLKLAELARDLEPGSDYELDQNGKNIYLTDSGLLRVERILGCGNLYEPENLDLLTRLNCALHAEKLLHRDRHYIVRKGKVELVDEFTGRVAVRRHWPDNLQAAVEAKEGLRAGSKGMILGSVPLQHFLSLYPGMAGMTGTARPAAAEFRDFYGLEVVVMPNHMPCIRKDHPDLIFTHREARERAVIQEVKRVHRVGQPVLIGTGSVAESERLAARLQREGIGCRVLNARNDEMEAKIIARAGEVGAVTVSTNMAGRGVDIKLGGEKEEDRDRVAALGGLYVIGTNRHESRRVDDQLRGRAGRQGDPGESRFFISMEDDLVRDFDMVSLIPARRRASRQESPMDDPLVRHELARCQRIAEGYNADVRRQLCRYTYILEKQRRIIHGRRQDILTGRVHSPILRIRAAGRYRELLGRLGKKALLELEKQITLYHINMRWAEYLDHMACVREGIHLVAVAGLSPLDEFHKLALESFERMLERIDCEIVGTFNTIDITSPEIDLERLGLKGPSSTWTYLVSDSPDQFSNLPALIRGVSSCISRPLFTVRSFFRRSPGRNA